MLGCDFAGQVEAVGPAPVVDACYPLPGIADAYRQVDAGHKRGDVVRHDDRARLTATGGDGRPR